MHPHFLIDILFRFFSLIWPPGFENQRTLQSFLLLSLLLFFKQLHRFLPISWGILVFSLNSRLTIVAYYSNFWRINMLFFRVELLWEFLYLYEFLTLKSWIRLYYLDIKLLRLIFFTAWFGYLFVDLLSIL